MDHDSDMDFEDSPELDMYVNHVKIMPPPDLVSIHYLGLQMFLIYLNKKVLCIQQYFLEILAVLWS